MSQAVSLSTGKRYGLALVCRVWERSRATVYWRRNRGAQPSSRDARPGPHGPCPDAELLEHIQAVFDRHPPHFYSVIHRRPRGPKNHEGTITTDAVNERWGTDLTSTITAEEGQACIFVAVDHCSSECVGIHASGSGNRFEALEPIRQGVREYFGAFDQDAARGLALRHDHGSQYTSRDFQGELAFLGIESSPSFVRAPEGNGCAERFIRTLKENLLWVRTFPTIEALRRALLEFKRLYNETWILARHGYKTPAQVRAEQLNSMATAA